MEKKTIKKILVTLIILFVIIITLFFADVYKVLNNEEPIFSIKKSIYEDGGTIEYIGFGYKIFKLRRVDYSIDEVKFGTIFSSYETVVGDEIND